MDNSAEGMATSLRAGLNSFDETVDAVIVLLGDMPMIKAETIDRLIGAYDPNSGGLIVVPSHNGKRGNPVVWSRRFFAPAGRRESFEGRFLKRSNTAFSVGARRKYMKSAHSLHSEPSRKARR